LKSKIQEDIISFYSHFSYPLIPYPFSKTHKLLMKKVLGCCNLKFDDLKNLKVLDAGCGTGQKSVFMARYGANVTALDINEVQLNEAKKNAIKYNVTLNFVKDDLVDLKHNEKYDLIVCLGVLHHTPSMKKGLENLLKLLKPNGKIVVALYNSYSRLPYRLVRAPLHLLIKDPVKIHDFVMKSKITFMLRTTEEPTLYDRYAVPFESYHTISEVKKIFKKNRIGAMNVYPKLIFNNEFLTQISWIFKCKTIFFFGGRK
jgi:2-polyprenyl-3-methyl-5-hydroxy-6-metoxy-1,4-benzoquinol methylase